MAQLTSQWWASVIINASTSVANYGPVLGFGGSNADSTENHWNAPCGGGKCRRMKVVLSAAPSGVASYRIQLSKNATPSTALDLTITGNATTGVVVADVSISAGDLLALKITPSGTPTAATIQVYLQFEPSTADYFCYPCSEQTNASTQRTVTAIAGGGITQSATGWATTRNVMPYAGTLREMYYALSATPTNPGTWTWNLKQGAGTNTPATLRSITISNPATAGSLTGLSDALSADDRLETNIVPASTPGARYNKWCVVIQPSTSGQFIWAGASNGIASASATNYAPYLATGGNSEIGSSESSFQLHVPAKLKCIALYVGASVAPGSGSPTKSYTYQTRVNNGNGNLSCSVSGSSARLANDSGHSDVLKEDDLIDLSVTPANTPSQSSINYSIALQIVGNPAVGGPKPPVPSPGPVLGCTLMNEGCEMADYAPGSVIDFWFTTADISGNPFALAGSPAISVYKTNSGTPSTSGVTLQTSLNSVVGFNQIRIDTSSDGTFYAAGCEFVVMISTGTVNGASVVGYVVGGFSLSHTAALRPATAGRQVVVDANGLVDATTVKVGPTGSGTAQTARDLGLALPAAAPQAAGGLVTSAAGSLDFDDLAADVDATETGVANIQTRLPAALVGGRMDSSIGAIANGVIVAASFAAGALDAVWSTATRLLTAGTNIVLAKGVGLTGLNDIAASAIINDATPFAGADIAAIKAQTDNLPSDPADESNILAAISALNDLSLNDIQTMIIEGTITFEQAQRILLAFAAGLTSGFVAGAPSSAVFKNPSGGATRMTGDIDANGNRSNVVLTP